MVEKITGRALCFLAVFHPLVGDQKAMSNFKDKSEEKQKKWSVNKFVNFQAYLVDP